MTEPIAPVEPSPWMNSTEAGAYLHKGRRFVLKEIRAGRLRAATVGGRGEVLTRREWCDHWVVDHATPVVLPARTRTPRSTNDDKDRRPREVA